MHIFFDESGDYAFPERRFDCYVQAAVICPDSQLGRVHAYVEAEKQELGVDELHATNLQSHKLLDVAHFIGASQCQLLAHVTDSVLVTKSWIAQFRLDQAATLKRISISIGPRARRCEAPRFRRSRSGCSVS